MNQRTWLRFRCGRCQKAFASKERPQVCPFCLAGQTLFERLKDLYEREDDGRKQDQLMAKEDW
ncbi:MAG: hypothetical protein AAB486_01230 [Patescibacteria group bacterium]